MNHHVSHLDQPANPHTVVREFLAAGKLALEAERWSESASTLRPALVLAERTPGLTGVTLDILESLAMALRRGSGPAAALPFQRRLTALHEATDPNDPRFPASLVTDPIAKQQLALDLSPVSVWPENFVPPQVDGNADLAAGELITSGSGTPADAVKLWERELKKWKSQHPDEFKNYTKWVSGG